MGMNGFRDVITHEFTSRFSPNQIIVSKMGFDLIAPPSMDSEDKEKKEPQTITPQVIQSIKDMDGVDKVSPAIMINGMQLRLEGRERPFSPSFSFGWDVDGDSSFFTGFTGDQKTLNTGEAFINNIVVNFYNTSAEEIIGKTLIIESSDTPLLGNVTKPQLDQKYEYKIVGVIDTGRDRTDAIITVKDASNLLAVSGNFTDGAEYLQEVGFDQVYITVDDEDRIDEIKSLINKKYGLETFSSEDILEFLNLITTAITLILVFFGIVSAFVASIGIINTMVMSIYEQTREIGINKAVGASNSQILVIFLIQSGLIGLIGGVLGLSIVFVATFIADPFIVDILNQKGFTTEQYFTFDPKLMLVIIISCILVGIIAGVYPAIKAARLDPVKALRYE